LGYDARVAPASADALSGRILVVDDEASMREFLAICLRRAGHQVRAVESGEEAARVLDEEPADLVITDLRLKGMDGLSVLRHARSRRPPPEVLVVTAYATAESAISALKQGAYDYLTKPFKVDEVVLGVERALERLALLRENVELREQLSGRWRLDRMVGKSEPMRRVFDLCRRVAPARTSVLLLGESGTGKELVARAIHALGPRSAAPFVAVNCGAIPEALLESELFGHTRGAFTGAVAQQSGLFVSAHGGTLFLDEVAELPSAMQVKLLRALQERKIRPVGASEEKSVDVRVVASTNRDLLLAVEEGRFREDLYYRLNVITIHLPPLRERREDVPLLVEHFARVHAAEQKKDIRGVDPAALARLCAYDYPGNVRELENIVERAVTLASAGQITAELLPPLAPRREPAAVAQLPAEGLALDGFVADLERDLIGQALERTGGSRTEAARLLGITLRSLRYRLDKHGIDAGEDGTVLEEQAGASEPAVRGKEGP
jgi:two-component system, NtrC family, response regulator PilR